jgi:ribosomal protein S18 acetylase RimI-like enzyme
MNTVTSQPDCRPLTPADVDAAARVMADAFADDPLCTFMLPLAWTRRRTLRLFFQALGELSVKQGRMFGAGRPLQAVAFWKYPTQADLSISLKSLGRFLPLLLTFYPLGLLRARAVLRETEVLHARYAHEPHFYLDNLAVAPPARGQGLSSRVIRPFLQQADEQRVIAYTDTLTPANVPLYEHFGFQCVQASAVAGTGLTIFALRRPVPG